MEKRLRRTAPGSVVLILAMIAGCGDSEDAGDAAVRDAGLSDAASLDAGTIDAESIDAASTDAASTDASSDAADAVVAAACGGGLDLESYRAADCFCGDLCTCFLGIPYGSATWRENEVDLEQVVDVYLPLGASGEAPVVVWAHANGSTREVGSSSALAEDVARPLLAEGTAFASVEFRHPVVNREDGAPRTDLAHAIQFLRCHAASLGTSSERMAAIARSRGTLAIWTALQDDLMDADHPDPARRQPTALRGVYGIQAQTSYWGEWIADRFFSRASRSVILRRFGSANLGHAVGDVLGDDPPVAMAYLAPLETLPLEASDCRPAGTVDCTHLPNFGDELCRAYDAAGIAERCQVTYDVPTADLYAPALPLLRAWLAP